jgi:hypothetical protein
MDVKMELVLERDRIIKWLQDNDYKVNKIVVGEWKTEDARWIEYVERRKVFIARLNEVLELLKPKYKKEE